ncbi:uncharacterized protein LOC113492880 [Trichoplusia ni]|uniref:Uncharacterized protein LOC113492880 n=1 Tax=Trichoplusia ni TaxID=7111 RepID=A0A7E5VDP3_TRINI|nr:uncharacterized protein LOC113492880 [Trichoplusia ni]XP_026726392.1 uncharacterized protein LOC113492880 [Trichoplusia ni]
MRALGRLPSFTPAGVILRSVYIFAWVTAAAPSDYGVPIEIKLWDTGRTPLAHMVDVTNMFGLKVLAEHNFLNDNNIAFSPYGLMGIMVALYEGVDGESSYQIQRGMQLPWNRNVMRVGFRDIHRTLKTYFVPEEGFLAGLALNNENVTFNDPYKKKLRFYGFDLENDQLPTLAPETNNTTNDTNTSATPTSPTELADNTAATVAMTSAPTREETTMTTNPNAETISTLDIRGGSTTAGSSLSPNAESTPMPSSVITTDERTTETTTHSTAAASSSVAEQTATTTAVAQSTPADEEAVSLTSQVDSEPTTNNEVDTSSVDTSTVQTTRIEPTTAQPTIDMTTSTEAGPDTTPTPSTTLQPTTESAIITSTITTESTPTEIVMSTTPETPTEQISTMNIGDMTTETNTVTPANDSTLETLERKKKSIVDFIFTNPPYVDDYLYYRSYDIGSDAANPGFDDKMFLANGLRSVQVTYMRYDTVLEYAYLPHLEASALRLPLDSERYYLLVVLPARGGAPELGRLLARMARESDLADIYSVLRPRRVKAIVPSFIVKGHVTLTTDLQKLGIRDVFEPRQRDFTPMTRQPGVYVRSIEQAVSVAIRKYRPDDQKKNRYVTTREPVLFSATYPFLYFVMDANIHVALMAGKMVDPLNSRIL